MRLSRFSLSTSIQGKSDKISQIDSQIDSQIVSQSVSEASVSSELNIRTLTLFPFDPFGRHGAFCAFPYVHVAAIEKSSDGGVQCYVNVSMFGQRNNRRLCTGFARL